jgi:hypothetical protein
MSNRCYTNEKVVDMQKNRAQFTPMRTTAADSRTKLFITLDVLSTSRNETRTDCLSNKGLEVDRTSSVIKSLVLLSAAVVRIVVNCARFFARLLLFHWYNIYTTYQQPYLKERTTLPFPITQFKKKTSASL